MVSERSAPPAGGGGPLEWSKFNEEPIACATFVQGDFTWKESELFFDLRTFITLDMDTPSPFPRVQAANGGQVKHEG